MLGRLGFSGRLMAIVLLALIALWAIGVGWLFVTETRDEITRNFYPLPEQVSAIVELLEAEPQARWPAILKAVSSDAIKVTIERARPVPAPGADRLPAAETFLTRYLRALGSREVIATIEPSHLPRWQELRFGQFWLYAHQPVRLAVSLETGGYAVFETRGQITRRLFGVPPGYGVGALGALVGIAAIVAIMREARPLRALVDAVGRFAVDATPKLVPVAGAPELRKLIDAVNDMQMRIAALLKGRTLLLGAISHDLKTYITRLRLRTEELPGDEQRAKAAHDLDDMTALIDDALAIARGAALSERWETVDLRHLLATIAAERDGRVRLRTPADTSGLRVRGDPVALRRLFDNLIDNALRFGTVCEIESARRGNGVATAIDDDGPGIPEHERTAVFEPFYRLDPSRSRATGGSGLGLAIVKQITAAHNGSVAVDASPLNGARVVVTLPSV